MPTTARRLWIDLLIVLCVLAWVAAVAASWNTELHRWRGPLVGVAIAATIVAVQVAIAGWLNERSNRRHGRTMAQLAGIRQEAAERHREKISATAELSTWLQQISARLGELHDNLPKALEANKWAGYTECAEDLGMPGGVVPINRRGGRN